MSGPFECFVSVTIQSTVDMTSPRGGVGIGRGFFQRKQLIRNNSGGDDSDCEEPEHDVEHGPVIESSYAEKLRIELSGARQATTQVC